MVSSVAQPNQAGRTIAINHTDLSGRSPNTAVSPFVKILFGCQGQFQKPTASQGLSVVTRNVAAPASPLLGVEIAKDWRFKVRFSGSPRVLARKASLWLKCLPFWTFSGPF